MGNDQGNDQDFVKVKSKDKDELQSRSGQHLLRCFTCASKLYSFLYFETTHLYNIKTRRGQTASLSQSLVYDDSSLNFGPLNALLFKLKLPKRFRNNPLFVLYLIFLLKRMFLFCSVYKFKENLTNKNFLVKIFN